MDTTATQLWLLTDNKPGHRNQLRGLVARMQALMPVDVSWIDVSTLKFRWTDLLGGKWPGAVGTPPALVIGAGSSTHRWLLMARRAFRAYAVVLMKPSLPLSFFDAAIIPRHDNPPSHDNVLATRGVVNSVVPPQGGAVRPHHTILVGGPSKHFRWSDGAIIEQLTAILLGRPDVHWTVADSRRTPASFRDLLRQLKSPQLTFVPHEQTSPGWLPDQLSHTAEAWVTPDSVSMVYEAITSGAATGLFKLDALRYGRIHRGLDELITQGYGTSFADAILDAPLPNPGQRLWEADRAAHWLKEKFTRRSC